MASNPLECKICFDTYNEDHCPRILPCSHSFCSPCIDELISTQKKECPVCMEEFTANSTEDLMINRDLLDVAEQLPSQHVEPKTLSTGPKKPFLQTTEYFMESVIRKGITVCQETEVEVNGRIESNNKMRKGLEGFIQMLDEIKLSSKDSLGNIAQDNKLLMDKLDIMKGKLQPMKDSEEKLGAATDFASAASTMDKAEKVLNEVDETVNEIKQLLQENKDNMKQDTVKMKIHFENALEVIERMIEEEEQQQQQEQEEGEQEQERDSVVNVTVADLRSPHGRLRGDAQREIFVVMTFQGTQRVARVKVESNNQISFTHLQEGVLPPSCFVIELESLMQGSPPPSPSPSLPPSPLPRGFLDLVYESTDLGRVIIRVTEGNNLGLNFLYLCAGGMGPSYADSQVSCVWRKGEEGEKILMGGYLPPGGGGGGESTRAVLSSREDWERENERQREETSQVTSEKAGDVWGFISYEGASKFWIVTRDGPNWTGYSLGKVEEGLDVLRAAILKYPDLENIKVAECGLIL